MNDERVNNSIKDKFLYWIQAVHDLYIDSALNLAAFWALPLPVTNFVVHGSAVWIPDNLHITVQLLIGLAIALSASALEVAGIFAFIRLNRKFETEFDEESGKMKRVKVSGLTRAGDWALMFVYLAIVGSIGYALSQSYEQTSYTLLIIAPSAVAVVIYWAMVPQLMSHMAQREREKVLEFNRIKELRDAEINAEKERIVREKEDTDFQRELKRKRERAELERSMKVQDAEAEEKVKTTRANARRARKSGSPKLSPSETSGKTAVSEVYVICGTEFHEKPSGSAAFWESLDESQKSVLLAATWQEISDGTGAGRSTVFRWKSNWKKF